MASVLAAFNGRRVDQRRIEGLAPFEPYAIGTDCAALMAIRRDDLSKSQTLMLAAIEAPCSNSQRGGRRHFPTMICKKSLEDPET